MAPPEVSPPRKSTAVRSTGQGASGGDPSGATSDFRLLGQQRESLELYAFAKTESAQPARSAAAEVNEFFGRHSLQPASAWILQTNSQGNQATAEDIEGWIGMAAARHNVDPNLVRAVIKAKSNLNSNEFRAKARCGGCNACPRLHAS